MEACKQSEKKSHEVSTPFVKGTAEATVETESTESATIEININPTEYTTFESNPTTVVTATHVITMTPTITAKPTTTLKTTNKPTMEPTAAPTEAPPKSTEEWESIAFSDEEIAEMAHMYIGCPTNYGNGPDYYMTIEKITKTNAKIELNYVGRNGSPLYEATDIEIKLGWGNHEKSILVGSFDWDDNWGNAGIGTIKIEKDPFAEPYISLNVKQTYTAETNRATLDTKGDKTFVSYFYHG